MDGQIACAHWSAGNKVNVFFSSLYRTDCRVHIAELEMDENWYMCIEARAID